MEGKSAPVCLGMFLDAANAEVSNDTATYLSNSTTSPFAELHSARFKSTRQALFVILLNVILILGKLAKLLAAIFSFPFLRIIFSSFAI